MSRYVTEKIAIARISFCEALTILISQTHDSWILAHHSGAKVLESAPDASKFAECAGKDSALCFQITRFACLRDKDTPSSFAHIRELITP
jgi:hypothetical protein